ncbi:MAG TPA: phosphoglycerate kinase [Actinomycetota bacterium]|nr:phosphoglycerate kinase [Actinomycetota bacterium]
MRLRTLDDLGDLAGLRVFVRLDLNLPLEDGVVTDDARIRASLPTLTELLDRGASIVAASHLGRPRGRVDEALRLRPVAELLRRFLDRTVEYVPTDGVLSSEVEQSCQALAFEPGRIVLLENLRFDPGEEANDRAFAQRLAGLADLYVDDAFGSVHRAHASVVALPAVVQEQGRDTAGGRLLQREVEALSRLVDDPARPYVAVLGGAKVSDKLATIGALVERVDALLIGGAMAFTFLAADGGSVGDSLVELDRFDEVRAARARADERGVVLQLPEDVVAATAKRVDAPRHTVPSAQVPARELGLDIGPRTVEEFARTIADAKTIVWNGPMGVFELEPFSGGTRGVATAIAGAGAFSVVGGGDSLAAVKRYGLEGGFDHLSTGGGASLEFIEGRELPGINVLETAP